MATSLNKIFCNLPGVAGAGRITKIMMLAAISTHSSARERLMDMYLNSIEEWRRFEPKRKVPLEESSTSKKRIKIQPNPQPNRTKPKTSLLERVQALIDGDINAFQAAQGTFPPDIDDAFSKVCYEETIKELNPDNFVLKGRCCVCSMAAPSLSPTCPVELGI